MEGGMQPHQVLYILTLSMLIYILLSGNLEVSRGVLVAANVSESNHDHLSMHFSKDGDGDNMGKA